ncbi:SAP domain-containing protein [Colletotrichum somersetense]|nr:SAP domain-containing protein [Colletotrichum somersetense]
MSILPPSELSAPPYSPSCAPDGGEEAQSQVVSKPRRKPKVLQYPSDVPRMTRLGPCTFGVNTGPVADDADLTKLTPETIAVREAADSQAFGPISQNTSVTGSKRTWARPDEKGVVGAVKRARKDAMYIIKQRDNYDGSPGFTVSIHGTSSDTYQVTIGNETSCNCTSMTFRPKSNCKHIIYVLTHVLRAPDEFLPQRTLFTEELTKLLDRAPKVRFTAAEASTDPSMSDGVPKPKDSKCCPVCFKDIGETQTVCCGKCGNHTHSSCFDAYAQEVSGWAVDCAVCQGTWSPAAV